MTSHGTTTRYQYGCRCERCRAAKAQQSRIYRRRVGRDVYVPAEPIAKHMASLGINDNWIARIAGLRHCTVRVIPTRKFVRLSTAKKILAITKARVRAEFQVSRKGFIPRSSTALLMSDLQATGFSPLGAGKLFGLAGEKRLRGKMVRASNARRIESVYRKLGTKAA